MKAQLDKLTTDIHATLTALKKRAHDAAGRGGGGLEQLEKSLRAEIDALNKRLVGSEPSVREAEALVAGWLATEAADVRARMVHAAAKADAVALEARAKATDDYARAMGVIAVSTVDRAARAAIEAAAAHVHLHSARRAASAR